MDFYQSMHGEKYRRALQLGIQASPNNLDNAVFDGRILPSGLNKIFIKQNLFDTVAFIKETVDAQRQRGTIYELPFVMFGYEDENGTVIIDNIEIDYDSFENIISSADGHERVASFAGYLTTKINEYAKNSTHKKPVIIHGHTHPSGEKLNIPSKYTNGFSFADMQGYKDLANSIFTFNHATGKDVQVAGMVVNSGGDFNAVFCDVENGNVFYKLDNIELEGVGRLPSYKGSTYIAENLRQL